jgi:quercetin dioxygenase-like cupin family protein
MLAGRLTVRYGDHEEVIEPGDAFYMPPGHVPAAQAGSEFVMVSPQEELAVSGGLEGQHATADTRHLTAAASLCC